MREINIDKDVETSVVVPVYNGERFLSHTLSCLINQTYKNHEIIVVDDGSTDNTRRVIEQFSFYRNLRYLHKENGGTGSALNLGHENALGKYVTWCSADNIYFSNFLEVLVGGLKSLEAQGAPCELIYSDFIFMDEQGRELRKVLHKQPQRPEDLIDGYDIGMSFLYTKALWDKTGPYWNRICEDYHWCVRAAQHTKFALINAILAGFRVHGGQISGHRREEEKAAADECKALARNLFGGPVKESIEDDLNARLGVE